MISCFQQWTSRAWRNEKVNCQRATCVWFNNFFVCWAIRYNGTDFKINSCVNTVWSVLLHGNRFDKWCTIFAQVGQPITFQHFVKLLNCVFSRIRLLFTPTKYHGTEAYVQHVPTWKMHIFTSVQIFALCVLWAVKSSRFSLALPFVLLLMIPLKQKISSYFTATEMAAVS